jgi:hypothetical protein
MEDLVGPSIVLYYIYASNSPQERNSARKSGAHQGFHSVSFLENVRGAGLNNPLSKQPLHENHS